MTFSVFKKKKISVVQHCRTSFGELEGDFIHPCIKSACIWGWKKM